MHATSAEVMRQIAHLASDVVMKTLQRPRQVDIGRVVSSVSPVSIGFSSQQVLRPGEELSEDTELSEAPPTAVQTGTWPW
jgi:hypothetical protein